MRARPDALLEGVAGLFDGEVDVLFLAGGDLGERFAGRRIDRIEGPAANRRRRFPPDDRIGRESQTPRKNLIFITR